MWFKNLKTYRLSADWPSHGDDLEAALARQAYQNGTTYFLCFDNEALTVTTGPTHLAAHSLQLRIA